MSSNDSRRPNSTHGSHDRGDILPSYEVGAKRQRRSKNNDDEQWPCAPDPNDQQPPEGKYLAAYVRANLANHFGRRVLELTMEIIELEEPKKWAGVKVIRYYNLPDDGRPPSTNSDYYKAWVQANDGKPPKRNERMSPRIFEGWWHIEVRHTKQTSTRDGCRKLEAYERGVAVVDRLIERAAGGPRR